jgi:protein AroM
MMPLTGFVTIGQSPRNDVLHSMLPYASLNEVPQAGALDDVSDRDLVRLTPDNGETPFVTRLRDSREVLVDKKRLIPHLQAAVTRVQNAGATSVVVLCTGAFPDLRASVPLIFPDSILRANVNALLNSGRLGVVMPNEGQRSMMHAKWAHPDRLLSIVSVSPYTGDGAPDQGAINELRGCDLVVLDCMGFSESMRSNWQGHLAGPVILANRLVGRVLEEIDPELGR